MRIEPHVWVRDFGVSLGWYQSVLGFEPVQWYPDEATATWVQLQRGDASVMLAVVPDPDGLAPHQRYMAELSRRAGIGGPVSMYLHVDDVDAVYTQARTAGVDPIEDIWDAWWGGRQFTVVDPDGNWWTAFQATD